MHQLHHMTLKEASVNQGQVLSLTKGGANGGLRI
jgi:hypothetical protein